MAEIDVELLKEAQAEYSQQREQGALKRVEHIQSFSPKAGTLVDHYWWYSSNGLRAKLVRTSSQYINPPALVITDWHVAPKQAS